MAAPWNLDAVTDVAFHSTHRKGYKSKLLVVHSKGGWCNFWGLLLAKTGDGHDEIAAMDLSMFAVSLTPSWFVWILTVMPVWLYFSSFLFCSVLFLNTKLYILYEYNLCLIFITVRKLTIQLSVKDCPFRFLFEDFRPHSRCNNVNYGAWHACKPLFGSSVATRRLVP